MIDRSLFGHHVPYTHIMTLYQLHIHKGNDNLSMFSFNLIESHVVDVHTRTNNIRCSSYSTDTPEVNKSKQCRTWSMVKHPEVLLIIAPWVSKYPSSKDTEMPREISQEIWNLKRETWATPETDEDVEDAVGLRMDVLGYGCTDHQCACLANAPGMDVHAFTLHERPTPECQRDHSYVEAL
ncbi:hypothetical protein RU639_005292 [Aspergillus parasiticus]